MKLHGKIIDTLNEIVEELLQRTGAAAEDVWETVFVGNATMAHLFLGILAYQNNWFYKGLIRGLGTTSNPVMVFSETSYIRGYTPYVNQENNNIIGTQNNSTQPIARYIPDVWLGRFFPEDIPSQLYNLAIHTDGYWIFTADSLWSAAHQSGPYALHGSNEDYWVAFKKANDELKAFSRDPGRYQSTLPNA